MNIINAGYEILTPIDRMDILKSIETAGRCCYKSEDRITETSAADFTKMLISRGHEAMIEHRSLTVKFVCDRGVSHEIVRHRIASYAQESTRYVNYSKDKFGREITVIKPLFYEEGSEQYRLWYEAMQCAEKAYMALIESGSTPQEARAVLPSSLKTELVVTMNLREWRHFFKLRTSSAAHPQIIEVARPLLNELKDMLPEVFFDLD